jgi:hypothetical protein
MADKFRQGPVIPSVSALPTASAHAGRLLRTSAGLYWSNGSVWLGPMGPSKAPVVTDSNTTYNVDSAHDGDWRRFTSTSAKTVTVRNETSGSVHPLPSFFELHLHNTAASGNLTITGESGVVITPQSGGTLVVPPNGIATLKRELQNRIFVFGTLVPA